MPQDIFIYPLYTVLKGQKDRLSKLPHFEPNSWHTHAKSRETEKLSRGGEGGWRGGGGGGEHASGEITYLGNSRDLGDYLSFDASLEAFYRQKEKS